MKNVSIFEPQIETNYAYKKERVFTWCRQSSICLQDCFNNFLNFLIMIGHSNMSKLTWLMTEKIIYLESMWIECQKFYLGTTCIVQPQKFMDFQRYNHVECVSAIWTQRWMISQNVVINSVYLEEVLLSMFIFDTLLLWNVISKVMDFIDYFLNNKEST